MAEATAPGTEARMANSRDRSSSKLLVVTSVDVIELSAVETTTTGKREETETAATTVDIRKAISEHTYLGYM